MIKGVTLNGVPLHPECSIDLEIKTECFTFHYIYRPVPAKRKSTLGKSSPRSGRVRKISVESYLKGEKQKFDNFQTNFLKQKGV